jgi:gamma-glutamylcyclotransferase
MYYFAYGSNMNWPQMQRRCPSARFVCVGRLIDYHFGITHHSRSRDCGTANVCPAPGEEVWGVVYDVSDGDLALLDGFEDGYRRETLLVHGAGRQPLAALVYVAELERGVPLPSAEYKGLIVAGAKHWHIPKIYLTMLEAIEIAQELAHQLDRCAPLSPEAKLSDESA